MTRLWADWQKRLNPRSLEALKDYAYGPLDPISANEIANQIIRYQGGLHSGIEMRALVYEVYGVAL